jgi:hypothetical protein
MEDERRLMDDFPGGGKEEERHQAKEQRIRRRKVGVSQIAWKAQMGKED